MAAQSWAMRPSAVRPERVAGAGAHADAHLLAVPGAHAGLLVDEPTCLVEKGGSRFGVVGSTGRSSVAYHCAGGALEQAGARPAPGNRTSRSACLSMAIDSARRTLTSSRPTLERSWLYVRCSYCQPVSTMARPISGETDWSAATSASVVFSVRSISPFRKAANSPSFEPEKSQPQLVQVRAAIGCPVLVGLVVDTLGTGGDDLERSAGRHLEEGVAPDRGCRGDVFGATAPQKDGEMSAISVSMVSQPAKFSLKWIAALRPSSETSNESTR